MHRSLDEFEIQSDLTMCFTRPRYQVSVYRTIGPLVILYIRIFQVLTYKDIATAVESFVFLICLYTQ